MNRIVPLFLVLLMLTGIGAPAFAHAGEMRGLPCPSSVAVDQCGVLDPLPGTLRAPALAEKGNCTGNAIETQAASAALQQIAMGVTYAAGEETVSPAPHSRLDRPPKPA